MIKSIILKLLCFVYPKRATNDKYNVKKELKRINDFFDNLSQEEFDNMIKKYMDGDWNE